MKRNTISLYTQSTDLFVQVSAEILNNYNIRRNFITE